jgi:putative hemolysin
MVSDSRGVITGMITLEDIVEELLGDIQDEYDMLPIHAVRSGQGWVAGGGISLTRLEELTGIEFDRAEMFPNLNAWVSDRLGHLPIGGDTLEHQGVRIVVRKVRRQRVLEALVTR